MAFITDDVLAQYVSTALAARNPNQLPLHWRNAVVPANVRAYNTVLRVMLGRGFTLAQVNAWSEAATWNRLLGVCAACWDVSKGDDDRGEPFRREWEFLLKELTDSVFILDGAVVDPSTAATRVGYGEFDTANDTFTVDDVL